MEVVTEVVMVRVTVGVKVVVMVAAWVGRNMW